MTIYDESDLHFAIGKTCT